MTTPTHPSRRRRFTYALLAGTAVAGLAFGGAWTARAQTATDNTAKPGEIQIGKLSHPLPDFVALVKEVKPAVVSITSKMPAGAEEQFGGGHPQGPQQQMPFGFPFPFAQMQPAQPRIIEARGSGFLIDSDGTIVTNNHVVQGATSVSVTLDDGTVLPAKVIGRDKASDLAVLRIDAHRKLPFIRLGNSDEAQPGAWVIAVGNPFGLGGTVTAGIVSARGRDIGEGNYDSFIQVDAPINQGNSGGPLITQDGKVVGVNSAIITPSGGSVGIGFAIPSNTVKSVVSQLEKTGHVVRGYVGVEAQAVTAAMAEALHLPTPNNDNRGALVASVSPDSPASKAGLKAGDVVTEVNGHAVGNQRDLAINVSELPPGSHANLQIYRDGQPQTVDVTIGTLPANGGAFNVGANESTEDLGVALSGITPDLRDQLDLADGQRGAVITQIKPGSLADQAGLQTGDVITAVGNAPVTGVKEAARAIHESLHKEQAVALRIIRDGQPLFVAVAGASQGGNG